jgi:ATP-dependent Clp protease, protease subunit
MVHHIYVYGVIGEDTTAKGVLDQLMAVKPKKGDYVRVHIHSPGGYVGEGYAIHDLLSSQESQIGFILETFIEGDCKSIATAIALSAKKENRFITANSEFMIHNPWAEVAGDSTAMARAAKELREEELKLAQFYATKTKNDVKDILKWMRVETSYNADQALQMGFASKKENTMKAVALHKDFTNSNKSKMNIIARFKGLMKALEGAKALDTTLEDGTAITVETQGESIAVGDMVTFTESGLAVEDGEHTLSDGTIVTTVGGLITDIVEVAAAPDAEMAKEIAALKAENAEMKALLEASAPILEAAKALMKVEPKALNIKPKVQNRSNVVLDGKGGKKSSFNKEDIKNRIEGKKA